MPLHKQLYKFATQTGIGLILLSLLIGGSQLFIKAGKQHQTDMEKSEIEKRTQISEKQAESRDREATAYRKADQVNIYRLILNDVSREQITADSPFWQSQPNQTRLIFDKFERCAGIWKNRKFTPSTEVCNTPNSPITQIDLWHSEVTLKTKRPQTRPPKHLSSDRKVQTPISMM